MGRATPERGTHQLPLWSTDRESVGDWTVRQSERARRLTVRVHYSGRVEVVVPRRTSAQSVEQFVGRHRDWIERKRREARTRVEAEPFPPRQIDLAACGETWRLQLSGREARRPRVVELTPGLLALDGDAADSSAMSRALREWLVRRAYFVLGDALSACAKEMGVNYSRLLIRRQRTRWGSCSRRGTISLNCCTLFQRPEVARYLLVHELSHRSHMNHSPRFWQHVERYCQDYRALDRELLAGWKRVPAWVFIDAPPPL